MPVKDYLDERLDDTRLKGLLAATGVTGLALGPRAGGTTLMWLYQNSGGFMGRRQVRGGLGRLSDALAASARAQGAEIRTGVPVSRITMDYHNGYRATGVETTAGERLSAKTVASNADPRRTLFDLVGPQYLDPSVMREIRNMRFQGCVAKLDLALDGLPGFTGQASVNQLSGRIRICPGHGLSEYFWTEVSRFLKMPMPTWLGFAGFRQGLLLHGKPIENLPYPAAYPPQNGETSARE
jgi:phytoene dehydrogenase-like protein